LLHACESLLARGIHPTTISEGFQIALDEALKVLKSISTTIDLNDRDALITCVNTSLASKVKLKSKQLLAENKTLT
jgi:T-complex protein 1 subunit delta